MEGKVMIELSLAKELKNAGLEWEHKKGDWFHWKHNTLIYDGYYNIVVADGSERENCDWLPTLSQILGEIEKAGWDWSIAKDVDAANGYSCMIIHEESCLDYQTFWDDTPEAAAAAALLFIMREGKE